MKIEWQTRQTCSECGIGAHVERVGYGYECEECGHLHPLRFSALAEGEGFWVDPEGYLWVRKIERAA